jgi:hypothetical protein
VRSAHQAGKLALLRQSRSRAALAARLLLGVACACALAACAASGPASPTPIAEHTLEERYGIRITLIAVTAGGGMVDLRYKVIDRAKAEPALQDPTKVPVLLAEDGTRLPAPGLVEPNQELVEGRVYYMLYPNTRGVVRPGTRVTVIVGEVELEPWIAQ